METHARFCTAIALFLCALPSVAVAQSITIIGGDSYAKECYMSATLTVQMNSASRSDLANCNRALEYGVLSQRNRMATYVNRGIVYAGMEKYNKAMKDYSTAINMAPETSEAYVNRGNLYFLGALYGRAVTEYTVALDTGLKKEHVAYYNRGMAYEYLKEYGSAEADYRRAIALLPDWTDPHVKLERVLAKVKKAPATP